MVAAQDVYGLTLFKSTGKGDQPMKYAMERATAQGHEFFIELVQRGEEGRETHLFGSTRDANAFLSLQQDIIREKGAYLDFREIIRADRPARFYADIEWKVPLDQRNDALALEVVSGVARAAEALARGRLAVDLDPARWVLARGSREKKGEWRESFHLTHLDFTFESNHVGMRLFAGALLLAGGTSVVDGKVYTKNRVFRVPWAAKVDDPTRTPLRVITPGRTALDALVTPVCGPPTVSNAKALLAFPTAAAVVKPSQRRTPAPAAVEATDGVQGELQAMLRARGDQTSLVVAEVAGQGHRRIFRGSNNGAARTCPSNHVHESNNFYLSLDTATGRVFYHCHQNSKGCSRREVFYGTLPRGGGGGVDDVDQQSPWGASAVMYDAPWHRPFDPLSRRVQVSRSPMATGKTTSIANLVRSGAYGRILVVSSRVQYTKSAQAVLPEFVTYKDDGAEVLHADRLIIQYESLHRLAQAGVAGYDLLVLDEIESLLCNATCVATNGARILDNAAVFESLVSCSTCRVVAVDADLSRKSLDVLSALVREEEELGVMVNVRPGWRLDVLAYGAELQWLGELEARLQGGERCYVATGSRAVAEEKIVGLIVDRVNLARAEEGLLAPLRVLLISKTTTAQEMDAMFGDINRCWVEYDLVIVTPKVTVGADFTVAHFHHLFCYCTPLTVAPRVINQMLGRVRRPIHATVHMFISRAGTTSGPRPTLASVRADLDARCLSIAGARGEVAPRHWLPSLERRVVVDPDTRAMRFVHDQAQAARYAWLYAATVWNTLEDRLKAWSYEAMVIELCADKGYTFARVAAQDSPFDEQGEDATRARRSAKRAREDSAFDAALPLTVLAGRDPETVRRRIEAGAATEEDVLAYEKHLHCKRFRADDERIPVDGRHYRHVRPHLAKLFAAARHLETRGEAFLPGPRYPVAAGILSGRDAHRGPRGPEDARVLEGTTFNLAMRAEKILAALGVGDLFADPAEEVPSGRVLEREAEIAEQARAYCLEADLPLARGRDDARPLARAKNLVNKVLGHWVGARLVTVATRNGRTRAGKKHGGRGEITYTYKIEFPVIDATDFPYSVRDLIIGGHFRAHHHEL
jgi:hypothetical protein